MLAKNRRKERKAMGLASWCPLSWTRNAVLAFPSQIERINNHPSRAQKEKIKLSSSTPTSSSGLVFFKHGSGNGREGFWHCACLLRQLEELMDVFDILYPERQLVVEVDWSSGHVKMEDNGLISKRMNAGWGGKQGIVRDTEVTADCLGDGPRTPQPEGVQSLVFLEGEHPFSDPKAEPFDQIQPLLDNNGNPALDENGNPLHKVIPGYIGKPKVLRQILHERGLYVDKMIVDDMRVVLRKCSDFASEMPLLQRVVQKRGHILLLSPKCHPEVAGVGVEYAWGKSKLDFRRKHNNYEAKYLEANVQHH